MKYFLLLTWATLAQSESCTQFDACSQPMPQQTRSLLQARSGPTSALEISAQSNLTVQVNPSGAAAPLDESGYRAVADRCCQAEMQEFIRRQAKNLGMEVCDSAGLRGMVPYHSCEKGPQSFSALSSNLVLDSSKRCTWLGSPGQNGVPQCPSRPSDCPDFTGVPLPDCGCSRSKAAKLDFAGSSGTHSNLGGSGPDAGAQELRLGNVGISESGQRFDLVVTTLTPYVAAKPEMNGINSAGFGNINIQAGISTDFLFSFMVPGTNTPLKLSEVHMALFDLDGGFNGKADFESFASKGYSGYVTDATPNVIAETLPDGRTRFTSPGAKVDNPVNPGTLTLEQRKACVMYFYKNVDSFQLTFAIAGPQETWGRNLNFYFDSPLNDRCGP